ncbi:MAG: glycosyl hydrolase family 57 [Myxococcales bacterium]|nr:glycosyl hydrolase family 57 [Myxococcales bacterium]
MTPTTFPRLTELEDGLPCISGSEAAVEAATRGGRPVALGRTPFSLERVDAAFAVALHMHQPLVLEDGPLETAPVVGNLEYMMRRSHVHGMHDAPVFARCYERMATLVPELVAAGRHPRVMLDYSGELLFGLRQMGRGDILDSLRRLTEDARYVPCVEWLGTLWGHAVVSSTPGRDLGLHLRAWQHHFAAVLGWEALGRVRGFSPPEMQLPNHPDVCFAYVTALRAHGYRWLLVQEHTVEELDGRALGERHLPRRLVARSSRGEEASITALVKTQGSDTKLVGQMQPLGEARSLSPRSLAGQRVPPLVTQIADGENGGVMMNEFPDAYRQAFGALSTEGVVGMNGMEYLELLEAAGIDEGDFAPIEPRHQHAIWQRVAGDVTPERVAGAIETLRRENPGFDLGGGSWTAESSWVRGYGDVLDPMNELSARFHAKLDAGAERSSRAYRAALFHLLATETSCYRYWGQGRFTDYARELCRRGRALVDAAAP